LIEVDQNRSFEDHKFTHLTPYCIRFLKLDPDAAKTLVRIVRKSIDVPELAQAVIEGTIHVSNAKVIASIITPENKEEWIKKAKDLPKAKLEKEIAASGGPDKKRVSLDLSLEALELLKRANELLSSKDAKLASQERTIEEALREYVYRHDPVEKAKRSKCPQDSTSKTAVKHQVNDRDDGRCVLIYDDGSQCEERKWIQHHHVIHKADGGEDSVENMVCLCAAHHRMIHQTH
ncbi:MAG: HNH endonuclease, partial [Proteobacteria bacterium]